MTNKTFFISELTVVKQEKKEFNTNWSSVESHLNNMNIGVSQEIIVSGKPMTGEYRVNTYKKVNDICVELVKSEIRG